MLLMLLLMGCQPPASDPVDSPILSTITQSPDREIEASITPQPSVTPTLMPPCYLTELPADAASSYAVLGWQAFAAQMGINLAYFYFPADCSPDSIIRDGERILYSSLVPDDRIGLVVLNPVDDGMLGVFYEHLVRHEYWQMGPEDYPALLEDSAGVNKNLVFLRVDELNGDETIVGNPLEVMTSLAEHEYIHIVQSRSNPTLAEMVWGDKDYQYFIEGYANIGNVSSQRYYFETQAAIALVQNLDLMNRGGTLQPGIATALQELGMDSESFLANATPVYDRHIEAFFLRVGGQAYVDGLRQGVISPYLLFVRAGSGDLIAYDVIRALFNKLSTSLTPIDRRAVGYLDGPLDFITPHHSPNHLAMFVTGVSSSAWY